MILSSIKIVPEEMPEYLLNVHPLIKTVMVQMQLYRSNYWGGLSKFGKQRLWGKDACSFFILLELVRPELVRKAVT